MRKQLVLTLAIISISTLGAFAEDRVTQNAEAATRARIADVKDATRLRAMVDEASGVYGTIVKGPQGEVPQAVLMNARCIAVLPNVLTGALLVGGAHGEGLASCKDSSNKWSNPAPISLNQGSFGLQAGAKSADLVLFFQTAEASAALKRGNFALGADVSAVVGDYGRSVDTSSAGVVAYTRTGGLFAGASINGSKIGKDQSDIAKYYGKAADYAAILEGRQMPDTAEYTRKLTKLFP
jgi:lipid-binding SYLF domain-containing protein